MTLRRIRALPGVRSALSIAALATLSTGCTPATPQAVSQTAGAQITLSAQAQATAPNDEMTVVLAAEVDDASLGAAKASAFVQLDRALERARETAGIKPALGSLSSWKSNAPGAKPERWTVRGEVTLTSHDHVALTELSGELSQRLQIVSVVFSLSEEARTRQEGALVRAAALAWRSQASEAAQALAAPDYRIESLEFTTDRSLRGAFPIMPFAVSASEHAPRVASPHGSKPHLALPAPAAGDAEIIVSATGRIRLLR